MRYNKKKSFFGSTLKRGSKIMISIFMQEIAKDYSFIHSFYIAFLATLLKYYERNTLNMAYGSSFSGTSSTF